VRAVIEAGHVHDRRKIIGSHHIHMVHPLGHRTGGILAVADVLKKPGDLGPVGSALIGNLVADAPHHHAGVVPVVAHQIRQVLFRPFVKIDMIAVFHLGGFPFVKSFGHDHHSHFVACPDQFGSRHVVGSADGIGAHLLHDADLPADGSIVDGGPQRPQVVMVAHPFELRPFAVEEEPLPGDHLQGADAKGGGIFVTQDLPVIEPGNSGIEVRMFRIPQDGLLHHQLLFDDAFIIAGKPAFRRGHLAPPRIEDIGHQGDGSDIQGSRFFHRGAYHHPGKIIPDHRGGHPGSPDRNVKVGRDQQMNVPVNSGSRIPA